MSLRSPLIAIFFALFFKSQSQDILTLLKHEVHNEAVAQCLPEIANKYFREDSTIGVALIESRADIADYNDDRFLQTISAETRWSFLILSAEDCLNENFFVGHNFSSNETVVRVDEMMISGRVDDVVRFLEVCDLRILINEQSRFVVGLDESEDTNVTANVQRVLEALWVLDQVNVAVLIVTESKSVDIYSWFPVTVDAKPFVLDSCVGGSFRYENLLYVFIFCSTLVRPFVNCTGRLGRSNHVLFFLTRLFCCGNF